MHRLLNALFVPKAPFMLEPSCFAATLVPQFDGMSLSQAPLAALGVGFASKRPYQILKDVSGVLLPVSFLLRRSCWSATALRQTIDKQALKS